MHHADLLRWLRKLPLGDESEYAATVRCLKRPNFDDNGKISVTKRARREKTTTDSTNSGSSSRIDTNGCGVIFTPPQSNQISNDFNRKHTKGRRHSKPMELEQFSDSEPAVPGSTTPSTKRRKQPSATAADLSSRDLDETPRAERSIAHRLPQKKSTATSEIYSQASSDHASRISSQNLSQTSGKSYTSVRKRRRRMEVAPAPVQISNFNFKHHRSGLPPSLRNLVAEFESASDGDIPIISLSRKQEIEDLQRSQLGRRVPDKVYFDPTNSSHDLTEWQESPSPVEMDRILNTAAKFDIRGWDEAGWNSMVHLPLLCLAIPEGRLLEVAPCTSSRIHREYLRSDVQGGKMVDACLAINPRWPEDFLRETPASRAIGELSLDLPGFSINHTDFSPLVHTPIAVSIETKRLGGDVENAKLQLGVWQAAQLDQLERLASRNIERQRRQPQQEEQEPAGLLEGGVEDFEFLPSIYIVGHEWKFAATTKQAGKIVLWTECLMGDTTSLIGIYRVVWCIRRLERYIVQTYWPWYKAKILGLSEDSA